jgi:hydroxybutyrate-dimer hydrolase
MWDHLVNGTALPPSQVVRTVPRGAAANPLTAANVTPVQAAPAAGDVIVVAPGVIDVPN